MAVFDIRKGRRVVGMLALFVLWPGHTTNAQTLSDFINGPSTNGPGSYVEEDYKSDPYYSVTRLPLHHSNHLKKRNESPSKMKKPPIKKNSGCSRFRGRMYDLCVANQYAKSSKGKGTTTTNSKSAKGKKNSKSAKGKGYQTSKPRPRPIPSPVPYVTSPPTSAPVQSETQGPSARFPTTAPFSSTVSPTAKNNPSLTLSPTRVLPAFTFSPTVLGSPVPTTASLGSVAPSFPSASTGAPMTTGSTSPSAQANPSLTSAPTALVGSEPTSVPITGAPAEGTDSPAFTLAPTGQGGGGATSSPSSNTTIDGSASPSRGTTTAPATDGGGGTGTSSAPASSPTTEQPAGGGETNSPTVLGMGGGSATETPLTNSTEEGGGGGTPSPSMASPGGTAAPSGGGSGPNSSSPSTIGAGTEETAAPSQVGGVSGGQSPGGTMSPSMAGPGGGGGNGTMAPTSDGTMAATNDGTRSGTTNRVSATPFTLLFEIGGAEYSEEDADAASEVTQTYLEEFLVGQFSGNFGVNVESVQVESIESVTAPDGTAELAYRITTTFPPDSTFVPEVAELDVLVELAFSEPTNFIAMLQMLPMENPFSTTSSIVYEQRSDLNRIGEKPANAIDPHHQDSVGGSFDISTPRQKTEAADFDVTPFTLSFAFQGGDPSAGYVAETSLITIAFLNEYLTKTFDDIAPGAFETLVGSGRAGVNDPREIGFLLAIKTAEGYSVAAPQNAIDMIVSAAFQEPWVSDLMSALKSLPPENPFSSTSTVEYRSIPTNTMTAPSRAETSSQSSDTLSPLMIASVVTVGVLVLALLAVSILLHQGRRGGHNLRKDAAPIDSDRTTGSNNLLDLISDYSSSPGAVFRNESLSSGIFDEYRNGEVRENNLASTFLHRSTGDPLLRSSWSINDEFLEGGQEYPGALHNANRLPIPLDRFEEKFRVEQSEPSGRSDGRFSMRCQKKPLEP